MKVYTLGMLTRWEGESIEPPIFGSLESALRYFEEMAASHVNTSYYRDDSELDEGELARWYETEPDGDVILKKLPPSYYYRILEREFIE